ncbi:MAG: hypothetical protein H7Z17_06615 [Fuerstia sp.]|nr:hypothetical protein [Fuerstiella sp.]
MKEWARLDADDSTRIRHLIGQTPGGLNGTVILRPTNVLDDQQTDSLFGDLGRDLFFGNDTGLHPDLFDIKKPDEGLFPVPNNA